MCSHMALWTYHQPDKGINELEMCLNDQLLICIVALLKKSPTIHGEIWRWRRQRNNNNNNNQIYFWRHLLLLHLLAANTTWFISIRSLSKKLNMILSRVAVCAVSVWEVFYYLYGNQENFRFVFFPLHLPLGLIEKHFIRFGLVFYDFSGPPKLKSELNRISAEVQRKEGQKRRWREKPTAQPPLHSSVEVADTRSSTWSRLD